jgi:hypothetical protein
MRAVRKTARLTGRHASSFNDESIETAEQQQCLGMRAEDEIKQRSQAKGASVWSTRA